MCDTKTCLLQSSSADQANEVAHLRKQQSLSCVVFGSAVVTNLMVNYGAVIEELKHVFPVHMRAYTLRLRPSR